MTLENKDVDVQLGTSEEIFHEYFLFRQLLAFLPDLYRVIDQIRDNPSKRIFLAREDSRGGLQGLLDLPRYVQQRGPGQTRTSPRILPVVRSRYSYDTPENQLALSVLRTVRTRLASNPFPIKSSEHRAARRHRSKLEILTKSPCFEQVRAAAIPRLYREATARVDRRRTGNDRAYRKLLQWLDRWGAQFGPADDENDETLPLSFPSGDAFWNRIFEIWCLGECMASLQRLGFIATYIRPLHTTAEEIALFERRGQKVSVLFQRASPLGLAGWFYADAAPLRGIPDITLVTSGTTPLFVDAKFREALPDKRRTEEIYKMLGYAENFNQGNPQHPFHALLLFPSPEAHQYRVVRDASASVDVITSTTVRADRNPMLDTLVEHWISSSAGGARSANLLN
ncbi:hypothetical protein [Arthrobacter sp. S2(2024)]|uniref:hypothetical protein n=1 Tax=Arthrobacter sp. S2(2024) TaxID=3111911 RepID=UPI002FC7AF78